MLRNGHVRFGGRVGETDRRQRRHRAPARPYLVVETYESPSWRWITGSGTPCGSESSRGAGRDLTRSAPALPGSAARRATAPQSARAAADRACPLVSGASPRRSHRPSVDQPDTRGPCSLARARRCDQASPRVNAAYRRRREQQLRRHRSLPSRADCRPARSTGPEPSQPLLTPRTGALRSGAAAPPESASEALYRRCGRLAQKATASSRRLQLDQLGSQRSRPLTVESPRERGSERAIGLSNVRSRSHAS